ncbi:hypothetical protein TURU_131061 [Turdus rufiventris]|nr:hypothetical protein TURU_131061 [Turdus rufiventris]
MASPCGRQQCSIQRRGVRHQLDSWRHKLIHCVGGMAKWLYGEDLQDPCRKTKDVPYALRTMIFYGRE